MAQISNKGVIYQLEELGLPSHEAAIYLAVLKLGEAAAGSIIREVKFHREQVYRALRNLVTEGFLSKSNKNRVSVFSAIDPSVFISRSRTKLALAQSLAPTLSAMQNKKSQIIQVWEGEEAIKRQLEDMINTIKVGGEYLVLGGVGELYYEATKKYYPLFIKQFQDKKITCRIIAYKGYEYPQSDPLAKMIAVKRIDRPFGTPASTVIYGNKYAIDVINPNNIAVITIEDATVANSFRQTFEALWS